MSNQKKGTNLLYQLIADANSFSDTIVLGRADPDFDTPEHIVAAAHDAMVKHSNEYVPPEGILPLRQAIAARMKRVNGIEVDPEHEVVVTNGGQEALFLMVLTVIGPGDEIIVPEPNYNTYLDSIAFARGAKITIPTFAEDDFRAAPEDVRKAITERTKALLMVSPNNPTAGMITPEDTRLLLDIAQEHDLVILADEIYDMFTYDDFEHLSPASLPGGKERTLTLNALSKAYAMTGWRLGWIVGPADLMAQVKLLKAAINGGTSIVTQYAAVAALNGPQEPVQMMHQAYASRRALVMAALDDMGIKYGVPRGGQFIFADISSTGMDCIDLAHKILHEQHVLVYPGSAFAKDRHEHIRITFLQPEEKLREGLHRLKLAMQKVVKPT